MKQINRLTLSIQCEGEYSLDVLFNLLFYQIHNCCGVLPKKSFKNQPTEVRPPISQIKQQTMQSGCENKENNNKTELQTLLTTTVVEKVEK